MKAVFALSTALFIVSVPAFAAKAPLSLQVYNPGESAIFPVSATLIAGEKEVILVDTQFQKKDAEQLAKMIEASGKTLTTIFISHHDPDFYFGTDTLLEHFPDAKVISTAPTAYLIEQTKKDKLAIWQPQLKEDSPKNLITPTTIKMNWIDLEGNKIEIKQDPQSPAHNYLWIPSLKAIVGGVDVSDNMHVWLADSQSFEARHRWLTRLDAMQALKPKTVIPGHYLKSHQMQDFSDKGIDFTRHYLETFNQLLHTTKKSDHLIGRMIRAYPHLSNEQTLKMGIQVILGDIPWHTAQPYPAINHQLNLQYGDQNVSLLIQDHQTMTVKFDDQSEIVKYHAIEIGPNLYSLAWQSTLMEGNVVQIDDFKNLVSHRYLLDKSGELIYTKGQLTLK